MVLPDIYSRRIKQERRAISPDVYQYDSIPSKLKVQIVRVFQDLMGIPVSDGSVVSETAWRSFHNFFCREKGFFKLEGRSLYSACIDYFLSDIETEDALDWIEIAILVAAWTHETYDEYDRRTEGITTKIDDGAEELNARFLDHDTGYQIANGKIIRIDRHFVHSEIVKPALIFLQEQDFQAANKEFMLAHKHYREQNYKDSVVAAHRAFESTLKAICAGLTIPFSGGTAPANSLSLFAAADSSRVIFPPALTPSSRSSRRDYLRFVTTQVVMATHRERRTCPLISQHTPST